VGRRAVHEVFLAERSDSGMGIIGMVRLVDCPPVRWVKGLTGLTTLRTVRLTALTREA
jgi:hypothetical protein